MLQTIGQDERTSGGRGLDREMSWNQETWSVSPIEPGASGIPESEFDTEEEPSYADHTGSVECDEETEVQEIAAATGGEGD